MFRKILRRFSPNPLDDILKKAHNKKGFYFVGIGALGDIVL